MIEEGVPDFLLHQNRDKPMSAPRPKPLVHSFSSLNCYEDICPHQYWHRYILKDIKFVETPQIKFGNEVHTAFERRLGPEKKPLPPHMTQWERFAMPFEKYDLKVEIKLGVTREGRSCDFFADDVFLRGKIDCVALNGSPVAYLPDWKTGKSAYEKKFELEVNALLIQARMPHLKTIKGRFAWLAEDRWGDEHELSDTRATWKKVNGIVEDIGDNLHVNFFEMRPSGLCGFCDVLTCKHNRKKQ